MIQNSQSHFDPNTYPAMSDNAMAHNVSGQGASIIDYSTTALLAF